MFPPTRKLPHLTCLDFGDYDVDFATSTWGAADLSCLVSCCPGLRRVSSLPVQPGLHVHELRKLSALTYLDVHFSSDNPGSFDESVRGLAALTQLQDLSLLEGEECGFASLLPLTSLKALTQIVIETGHNAASGIFLNYYTTQVSWSTGAVQPAKSGIPTCMQA